MPQINTNDPMNVLEFIESLRKCIRELAGVTVKQGRIDSYTEAEYDEENQKYTIDISFNQGDIRTLVIELDLNPDE